MRRPPARARLLPLCVVVTVGLAGALAACGSGQPEVLASKRSNERPSSSATPGAGSGSSSGSDEPPTAVSPSDRRYCDAIAAMAGDQSALGDDPGAAVEAMSRLADLAPEALHDDYETLKSVVGDLTALDQQDPTSIAKALEIVTRSDVLGASEAIAADALQRCGVALAGGAGSPTTEPSGPGVGDRSGPGDIDLEDVDAVRDEHRDESWSRKLTSTTILNDSDVTLTADASALLTGDEALAACRAVRAALVDVNPEVVVTIVGGSTPLATAPSGGECAPA